MATIVRTKQGTWRAQVRRKGKYASRTFRLKTLASEWASETERLIDIGCELRSRKVGTARTIADLIDLHIEDLLDVGEVLPDLGPPGWKFPWVIDQGAKAPPEQFSSEIGALFSMALGGERCCSLYAKLPVFRAHRQGS